MDTRSVRLGNVMLSQIPKDRKFLRFHLREISRIVRFIETARRLEVTTGWERWGINYCLTGTELLFGVIQNFGNSVDGYPTLCILDAAELYTLKWLSKANFIVCIFYHNQKWC